MHKEPLKTRPSCTHCTQCTGQINHHPVLHHGVLLAWSKCRVKHKLTWVWSWPDTDPALWNLTQLVPFKARCLLSAKIQQGTTFLSPDLIPSKKTICLPGLNWLVWLVNGWQRSFFVEGREVYNKLAAKKKASTVTRSFLISCTLSDAFLPCDWQQLGLAEAGAGAAGGGGLQGLQSTSRPVDSRLSCTLFTKGQQRTKKQNKNESAPMIFWSNRGWKAMRFASRLFRRNFLFALLYTLVSSERMIRSVWHDLNSTWDFSPTKILGILKRYQPAFSWNKWPSIWDDNVGW